MLDERPREVEWVSWLAAGGWAALILATVPLARAVATRIAESIDPHAFLWLTVLVIVTGLLAAARALGKRRPPGAAYAWLAVFGGALLWLTWTLRGNAVEAFHVAQYGVLSILFYRALVHRFTDPSVFVLSALLAGIVGICDEWVQWLIPDRFWGMRDVAINFLAAVLTQGALAAGLRPTIVSGRPSRRSISRLCYALAIFLAMLCASYANTPDRIAWYAQRVPAAEFLLDSQSMMVEYGYRHEDPDVGVFRSRFSRDQLRRLDRERGTDVARILDRYQGDGDWHIFRRVYTVPRDAYVHELGTHLFRRNRHLTLAREPDRSERKRRESYFIAQRENRILEAFFQRAIEQSTHRWNADIRHEVDSEAFAPYVYESAVSRNLITRVSRVQMMMGFSGVIAALLLVGIVCGRSSPDSERPLQRESR